MKRTFQIAAMLAVLSGAALFAWAQRPGDRTPPPGGTGGKIKKPQMADTVKANMYADNWFMLYINGELVAVDSIKFIPHNVVSVDILPSYPMTIAVMAKDNADPKTGMEYANTQIGDAGFILKFGDGTVTNANWKAKKFSWGPIDRDTKNPRVENIPIPENWFAADFDDSSWGPREGVHRRASRPEAAVLRARFQRSEIHLVRRHRTRQHGVVPARREVAAGWEAASRLLEPQQRRPRWAAEEAEKVRRIERDSQCGVSAFQDHT